MQSDIAAMTKRHRDFGDFGRRDLLQDGVATLRRFSGEEPKLMA